MKAEQTIINSMSHNLAIIKIIACCLKTTYSAIPKYKAFEEVQNNIWQYINVPNVFTKKAIEDYENFYNLLSKKGITDKDLKTLLEKCRFKRITDRKEIKKYRNIEYECQQKTLNRLHVITKFALNNKNVFIKIYKDKEIEIEEEDKYNEEWLVLEVFEKIHFDIFFNKELQEYIKGISKELYSLIMK